jgi:hypothetical protein
MQSGDHDETSINSSGDVDLVHRAITEQEEMIQNIKFGGRDIIKRILHGSSQTTLLTMGASKQFRHTTRDYWMPNTQIKRYPKLDLKRNLFE